jgi:hypothetical protein
VRAAVALVGAVGVSAALIGSYAIAGGAEYRPAKPADPCIERPWRNPSGLEAITEQIVLSALDGAACKLGTSREALALSLRSRDALTVYGREHGKTPKEVEAAVQDGLVRAVDDAEHAGAVNGIIAFGLRALVSNLPLDRIISLVQGAPLG